MLLGRLFHKYSTLTGKDYWCESVLERKLINEEIVSSGIGARMGCEMGGGNDGRVRENSTA